MFILALDMGKTKTFATIVDDEGQVYGKAVSGPSGMWLEKDVAIENMKEAIDHCLKNSKIPFSKINLISISWADLDTKKDWENAWKIIEELNLNKDKVLIEHDVVAAYYAVTWGEPGIVVIGGTGSIAFGKNSRGEKMKSSGWGWLIGDEGSAYWIAIKALNAVSRAYDGRGEQTLLTKKFKEYFKVEDEIYISVKVHKELKGSLTEVAKLAKIVDEVASEGDKVAKSIMEEAGRELALDAIAVAKKLNMMNEKIVIGEIGSVFKSKTVTEVYKKALKENLPSAVIKEPIIGYMSIIGPIIIAYKKLNIEITEEKINNVMLNVAH
jgi:N-acetylglucosamine kinase-like BadF-type ATPase